MILMTYDEATIWLEAMAEVGLIDADRDTWEDVEDWAEDRGVWFEQEAKVGLIAWCEKMTGGHGKDLDP